MNEIRGPGEMDFTSSQNLSETWRRWKRSMEYYLIATCTGKTEAQKVAIFMCMIGKDGQEIKDTFEFETNEDGQQVITTAMLFAKFEAHCKPKKNLVVERHRFLTRDQNPGESVDQYVTELKTLAASCEWGDLKDDLICSRIVSGILSRVVRERLLRESELKLDKAVEICRADELSRQQMKLFGGEASHVNQVKRGGANRVQNKSKSDKAQETKKVTEEKQERKRNACGNCGLIHPKRQCSAYGKQCNKCKNKQEREWAPGKVIEIADTPRSYLVETPEGAVYRRNRRHLRRDTSHVIDQQISYTDSNNDAEPEQSENIAHEQQTGSLQDQHQEASNTSDGYRTRSGRLVKVPDRY